MEILHNFGFDLPMLVAQIINFLVIFFVLKKFLYKPVMNMMKTREDKINLGLKQAEEASIKLEKALEEEKKILTKAQDESRKLIEEARAEALSLSSEIEENARVQTQKMLEDARAQMTQESEEIEKKISQRVSELAVEMLSNSLKGVFTEKDQKAFLDKALKKVKKTN